MTNMTTATGTSHENAATGGAPRGRASADVALDRRSRLAGRPTRVAAGVAAVLAAAVLTACSSGGDGAESSTAASSASSTASSAVDPHSGHQSPPASTPAGRAGDVMFAQMMIPHHRQAVTMSDIALAAPSSSAAVKRFATEIKGAQDPEIATMSGWLKEWGASEQADAHHDMPMPGMLTDAQLTDLRGLRGDAFDTAWLRGMIEHHRGAVTMATDVKKTSTDPRVIALADDVIAAQNREITEMTRELG